MQMLQRATVSSRVVTLPADDDHCVIDVEQPPLLEEFWKRRDQDSDTESGDVSLYSSYSGAIGKKDVLRERLATRCIHCIPFIIFFCFFALWWFSAPANLEIKDGRVVEAFDKRMSLLPLSFNATHVELASLASSNPPVSQNLTKLNGTKSHITAELEKKPKSKVKLKSHVDSILHFHNKRRQQKPKNEVKLKSY